VPLLAGLDAAALELDHPPRALVVGVAGIELPEWLRGLLGGS